MKRGRWESLAYRDFVRLQPCCHCGYPSPSTAHHPRDTGIRGGMGRKPDDVVCVPLCQTCHMGNVHQRGHLQGLTVTETRDHFIRVQRDLLAKWVMNGATSDPYEGRAGADMYDGEPIF